VNFPPAKPATTVEGAGSTEIPRKQIDGLGSLAQPDDETNKRLNEIEMLGEEEALGFSRTANQGITPGMRYLHSSRTINQLVIDRNRCVTIYLAVASLLWTATGAMMHAQPAGELMVPIQEIQFWCIPSTAATLTILSVAVALLLVRIRVGLIYEVAKMNVLLGLPIGRVRRINPLSVFFIMYMLISLGGGAMGSVFAYHIFSYLEMPTVVGRSLATVVGLVITALLVAMYVGAVRYLTADPHLHAHTRETKIQTARPAMGSVLY
jgi:hypothetical protein